MDADLTTIPKGLKNLAVREIIWALKSALEMDPTKAEETDHAKDQDNLNRIAAGKDVVDQADTPVPSQIEGSPGVVLIRRGKRVDSRHEGDTGGVGSGFFGHDFPTL
jgi:hypothetical protein